MTGNDDIVLLTKSYVGDFEQCSTLCASIDAFMPDKPHYLIVEQCDRALFAPLATDQRKIITTESLLPEFVRIRRPNGRNMWLSPYRLKPLDGWHVQQFAKLACTALLDAQAVVMVDSDVEFIRPIDSTQILRGGRTRLLRYPLLKPKQFHGTWVRNGAVALGLPKLEAPASINYVQNLVTWHPEVVRALLTHLARVSGRSWKKTLARQKTFSEYYLYGQFADHVEGAHQDLLFTDSRLLCHTLLYDFDHTDSPSEEAFIASLADWQVAFGIQSNIRMPETRRQALAAQLRAAAAPK